MPRELGYGNARAEVPLPRRRVRPVGPGEGRPPAVAARAPPDTHRGQQGPGTAVMRWFGAFIDWLDSGTGIRGSAGRWSRRRFSSAFGSRSYGEVSPKRAENQGAKADRIQSSRPIFSDLAADQILDNLIADKKALPMIVVMPNGRASNEPVADPRVEMQAHAAFEKELIADLIPFIESHYSADRSCERRALAGLSLGGWQSQSFGLGNLNNYGSTIYKEFYFDPP